MTQKVATQNNRLEMGQLLDVGTNVELVGGLRAKVLEAEIFEGRPDYLLESLDGKTVMLGNDAPHIRGWVRPEDIVKVVS